MKTPIALQRLAATLIMRATLPLLISAAGPTDQALYIDGRLRTVGEPVEGAVVTVERDGIVMQVFTADVSHLHMRLELQRVYILSFRRLGCISKQLLFDTHVPAEDLDNAPFEFPFKVTLEHMDEGSTLRYAGPVGFIRYYSEKSDFDYDRDYRMLRDPEPAAVHDIAITPMPPDLHDPMTVAPGALDKAEVIVADAGEGDREELTAAVPVLEEAAPARRERRMVAPLVDPTLGLGELVSTELRAAEDRAVTVSTVRQRNGRNARRLVTPVAMRSVSEQIAPVILPDGRTTDLIVEHLRVTTIVRVTKAGRTSEYRRVASRYGPVYYFRNGISCSADTYSAGSCER